MRAVGGLEDTVVDADDSSVPGTGFKFKDYNIQSFVNTVERAVKAFKRREIWASVVDAGMAADFSWKRSAGLYLDVYRDVAG